MSQHCIESQDGDEEHEYWHTAQADTPLLIDSTEKLEDASEIISKALIVGIDCEWPPSETGRHPSATVLQLAVWSPSQKLIVLILDLLALDSTATSKFLQTLFRRKETLKIGYSFKTDVFALDMALKSSKEGGAVAIIEPIIDLSYLHRHLLQLRCPDVHASGGGGLSGVVNANLGLHLDKSQQCSDWSCRPLTSVQLRYAATDAACLVALLDYFIYCWGQRRQETVDITVVNNSVVIENLCRSPNRGIEFEQAQVEAAANDWGEEWHLAGRKKIQREGGLSQYEAAYDPFSTSKKNKKAAALSDFHSFPLIVPWMDANKKIIKAPLFLADVMLQGLARQLRLWGFDAEALECVSKTERHIMHRKLVERAQQEGRVILTRDVIFMRRNLSDQAYFVRSETKREQLGEVVDAFGLPVMQKALLSRCAQCNGEFGDRPVAASELELTVEQHGVPPGVLERVKEFWVCLGCKKAYWQGSMYERAMERLEEALTAMSVSGSGGGKEAAV